MKFHILFSFIAIFICFLAQSATFFSVNSGPWDDDGTWSYSYAGTPLTNGDYPQIGDQAQIVDHIVTVDSGITVECDGFVVYPTSTLNIEISATVHARFFITNEGDVNMANHAALYLPDVNGSFNGVGSFNITRIGASGNTYNFVSSPVIQGKRSMLGTHAFRYVESIVGNKENRWAWHPDTLTPGVGYATTNLQTTVFSGKPNHGPIDVPLTYSFSSGDPNDYGWNLVGNPYPCAIDANTFLIQNTNLEGSVALWADDQSGGSGYSEDDYIYWNLMGSSVTKNGKTFNGQIASGQAFFVRTTQNNSEANFTDSQKSMGDNSAFIKSSALQRVWFAIEDNSDKGNSTLIGFHKDASDNEDRLWDAKKFTMPSSINLYSLINSEPFSIQSLSKMKNQKSVSMGMKLTKSDSFYFRISDMELMEQVNIELEDIYTGAITNLKSNDYLFYSDSGTFEDRFILHFEPNMPLSTNSNEQQSYAVLGLSENIQSEKLIITQTTKELLIKASHKLDEQMSIFNLQGQVLYQGDYTINPGLNTFDISNLRPGNYILILHNSLKRKNFIR